MYLPSGIKNRMFNFNETKSTKSNLHSVKCRFWSFWNWNGMFFLKKRFLWVVPIELEDVLTIDFSHILALYKDVGVCWESGYAPTRLMINKNFLKTLNQKLSSSY